MRFLLAAGALLACCAAPAQAEDQVPTKRPPVEQFQGSGAKLQGLDKITARIFAFEAPLDQAVSFGYLRIVARACIATPDAETPESTAFLEVSEAKPAAQPKQIFTGWMFASSASVSAMEHSVYDVWVVGCTGVPGEEDAASAENAPPPSDDDIEAPTDDAEQPLD